MKGVSNLKLVDHAEPIAVKSSVAASLIGIAPQTLNNWRVQGKGPRYACVGANLVVYRIADIEAWLDERVVGGEKP